MTDKYESDTPQVSVLHDSLATLDETAWATVGMRQQITQISGDFAKHLMSLALASWERRDEFNAALDASYNKLQSHAEDIREDGASAIFMATAAIICKDCIPYDDYLAIMSPFDGVVNIP